MAICTDNARLGRIGCGASYTGETQHSVAKVSWSTHPDGMAHISAADSTILKLWGKGRKSGGEMAHPAEHGFVQNENGRWGTPMSEERLERIRGIES